MNILIYANCQGKGIQYYLQKKIEGNYTHIVNYLHIDKQMTEEHISLFSNADLLIYQYCDCDTYYSTNFNKEKNIFQYVKKDCIKIGILSAFQNSFWPINPTIFFRVKSQAWQLTKRVCRRSLSTSLLRDYVGILCIKEYKDKGLTINDILKLYDENKINFKLKERFDLCEKHSKRIEDKYSKGSETKNKFFIVPLVKFIRDNYKKHKLFISESHPTSYIFLYVVNEVIKIFNKITTSLIPTYKNIFSNKIDEAGPGADCSWTDSIYARNELGIEWINEQGQYINATANPDPFHSYILKTNEEIIKEMIKNIYENV